MTGTWAGAWVTEHAGLEVRASDGDRTAVERLLGLALRRNPLRVHLVVSEVLAKHVPVAPARVVAAAHALGDQVRTALGGQEPSLVLGYAETATALGQHVAEHLGAPYLHSTRRPGQADLLFEEQHSHATTHQLQPTDAALLRAPGPVVLVDDEFTTGTTVANTIRALQGLCPRELYVVASLVDFRGPADRARLHEVAAEVGTTVASVAVLHGEIASVGEQRAVVAELVADTGAWGSDDVVPGRVEHLRPAWPDDAPTSGRHGLTPADHARVRAASAAAAAEVRDALGDATRVHVLGTEELMFVPITLAEALAEQLAELLDDERVTVSSTSRSPAVVLDAPGYALRHGLRFSPEPDPESSELRYAYNLAPGRFEAIVLVVDDPAAPDDLVRQLRLLAPHVLVVEVPHG